MNQIALLTPVFVLIIWTFIVFLLLAYGRVRFIKNPQDAANTKDLKGFIKLGNERVVEARLNDAEFFWKRNRSQNLVKQV